MPHYEFFRTPEPLVHWAIFLFPHFVTFSRISIVCATIRHVVVPIGFARCAF
ncbi:hypothetical protein C8Q78DRAFT_1001545 [Trametes maxima]|nr:hypothetical protein C8Q78DRAFT_1001545 [Trametes maxima]